MKISSLPCSLFLACTAVFVTTQVASAAPQDYRFQVVEPEYSQGDRVSLTIAITDLRTNTPVVDGSIIAAQMDMSPDGMADMRSQITPVSSTTPGRYSFVAKLGMAGNWRLAIAARLPGETEVIWREVNVKVAP